jgi:hypothetical protein
MKSFRKVINDEVRFSISPSAPCPCGSQISTSQCCLTATGFRKAPALTVPPPPKTGEAIESCYAKCLADCDKKRSREHFVSRSLLNYLSQNNGLRVGGFRWIKGEDQVLSPNALASKMLCKRHNSALSQLDAIAIRLFKAFDEDGVSGSGQQLIHLFSGHDIERWLLKILCGLAFSKNIQLEGDVDPSIPDFWLRVLFGEAAFPDGQGLYVCRSSGHCFRGPQGLELRAIVGNGRLSGMGLWACGYELVLSMSELSSRVFDGHQMAYRPLEFYATGRNFEKSTLLSWDGAADLGTISVNIGEPNVSSGDVF